jgi:glycosyltransferase involved in cell wall biosynthesis
VRSFLVPDEWVGWIRSWIAGGRQAAAQGADLLFSSSVPFSIHLAARRLAGELGIPWVMEMRDAWADNPLLPTRRNPLTHPLQRLLERRCLRGAWRVVVTTQAHAALLEARHAFLRGRVRVVRNGFDPDESPRRPATSGPLRILHAGNFYGRRDLSVLGQVVDALEGRVPGFGSAVLEVAGVTYDRPWEEVLGGLGPRRILHGLLAPDEVRALMREVHLGVIHGWGGDDPIHIPGKFYEYLGAGLPVLDLTGNAEVPALCEGTVPCWKVPARDREGLGRVIHEAARWWLDHPQGVAPPGEEHPLSARSVARRLADVFRECREEERSG